MAAYLFHLTLKWHHLHFYLSSKISVDAPIRLDFWRSPTDNLHQDYL